MGGEWKYDKSGQKYREVGKGCIEYAPTITIEGIEVYMDELEDFNRRRGEAKARRIAEQQEAAKNVPTVRHCPFSQGVNNNCTREKCALFRGDGCGIAVIADKFGADSAENSGGRCPFSVYARCDKCALNNSGCALIRLAASNVKGE